MAFHTMKLHFILFDNDEVDGICAPLDGTTTAKLFAGVHSAFERSNQNRKSVTAAAVLSDDVFLAHNDAKTIQGIIAEYGGKIIVSHGPLVEVKTKLGYSVKIFLVGGAGSLAAAMSELPVEEEVVVEERKPSAVIDLTLDEVVDLTEEAPPGRGGRAARAAKRDAAKREATAKEGAKKNKLKSKKAIAVKIPNNVTEEIQPLAPHKLKPALKQPPTKSVTIKLEGNQDSLTTPPPKTVYRKTPVPKEAKEAPKTTKGKKKQQPPDTPPVPPSPDTPSVAVVVDDDDSTKLNDDSDSTASYEDLNGIGFTQEGRMEVQQRVMAQMIDEFLADKLPDTPDSVREYMGKPIKRNKKEEDRRARWPPSSPDTDDSFCG